VGKEPWEFGDEFTNINRRTIELRYQFLPYIYSLFREHERSGQPVMRPLWYEFPQDKQTYLINDEFMVGEDILVAPVVKEGMTNRGIYLPNGAEWLDWWTGEKLESGKMHYLDVPLDRLPIFIRVGAVIPTQSVIQHTGEMRSAFLTLNVAAGIAAERTEEFTVFQDAGEGYGYRANDWREIKVVHKRGLLTITAIGNFEGQKIKFIRAIGIKDKPKEIRIDGGSVSFDFDAEKHSIRFEIPDGAKEIVLVR